MNELIYEKGLEQCLIQYRCHVNVGESVQFAGGRERQSFVFSVSNLSLAIGAAGGHVWEDVNGDHMGHEY